eukprot:2754981-Amphidinium_carterae.1
MKPSRCLCEDFTSAVELPSHFETLPKPMDSRNDSITQVTLRVSVVPFAHCACPAGVCQSNFGNQKRVVGRVGFHNQMALHAVFSQLPSSSVLGSDAAESLRTFQQAK